MYQAPPPDDRKRWGKQKNRAKFGWIPLGSSDVHPLLQLLVLVILVLGCFLLLYGILLLPNILGWQ